MKEFIQNTQTKICAGKKCNSETSVGTGHIFLGTNLVLPPRTDVSPNMLKTSEN